LPKLCAQSSIFHEAVKKLQGQTITVLKVIDMTNNLKNNLVSKSDDCLLSSAFRTILGKLGKKALGSSKISSICHMFYQTAVEYLCKWTSLENSQAFSWVTLRMMPHREEKLKRLWNLCGKLHLHLTLMMSCMTNFYKQYVNPEKMAEWRSARTSPNGH
jgi:hypothetical protein